MNLLEPQLNLIGRLGWNSGWILRYRRRSLDLGRKLCTVTSTHVTQISQHYQWLILSIISETWSRTTHYQSIGPTFWFYSAKSSFDVVQYCRNSRCNTPDRSRATAWRPSARIDCQLPLLYFRGVDIMKSYRQGNQASRRTGTPISHILTGGIPESLNFIELSIVGGRAVLEWYTEAHRGVRNVQ
jgi:hypothetical protein